MKKFLIMTVFVCAIDANAFDCDDMERLPYERIMAMLLSYKIGEPMFDTSIDAFDLSVTNDEVYSWGPVEIRSVDIPTEPAPQSGHMVQTSDLSEDKKALDNLIEYEQYVRLVKTNSWKRREGEACEFLIMCDSEKCPKKLREFGSITLLIPGNAYSGFLRQGVKRLANMQYIPNSDDENPD